MCFGCPHAGRTGPCWRHRCAPPSWFYIGHKDRGHVQHGPHLTLKKWVGEPDLVMFNIVLIWLWKSGLENQTRLCSTRLVLFILHWSPSEMCHSECNEGLGWDNCDKCIAFNLEILIFKLDKYTLFISSVRSSNSHPDLLLTHQHPTFSDHTGPQHWTFTFWATTAI